MSGIHFNALIFIQKKARKHMLGLFFVPLHCFALPNANPVFVRNFFSLPVATKSKNVDNLCSGVTALRRLVSW